MPDLTYKIPEGYELAAPSTIPFNLFKPADGEGAVVIVTRLKWPWAPGLKATHVAMDADGDVHAYSAEPTWNAALGAWEVPDGAVAMQIDPRIYEMEPFPPGAPERSLRKKPS